MVNELTRSSAERLLESITVTILNGCNCEFDAHCISFQSKILCVDEGDYT